MIINSDCSVCSTFVCIHVLKRMFLFFFKSGSSGKPGRPRQNARVRVEEIVAYRAFGVAETFLGHQVNASTAACFTRSLKLHTPAAPWSNWNRGSNRSMRNPRWGSTICNTMHIIYDLSSVAKVARWFRRINCNWIRINKSIFFHSREKVTLKMLAYTMSHLHCVIFF